MSDKKRIIKRKETKPEVEDVDPGLLEDIPPSVIALLDAEIPGWREAESTPEDDEAHALYMAEQVVKYHKKHGRFPTTGPLGRFFAEMRAAREEELRAAAGAKS